MTVFLGARHKQVFSVKQFFELGKEEAHSPFLTKTARAISRNLSLKNSIFGAFLLLLAYILSFTPSYYPLSRLFLISVYVVVGVPLLIASIEDILFSFDINIDVLMTLAAFSSYFLSGGYEGGLLLVLFALSGAIEDAVTLKAKKALSSLHELSPETARVVVDHGHFIEKAVADIDVGERILVPTGEVVPLDGIVVDGMASVTLSHITGESTPLVQKKGEPVLSGAKVIEGAITVQVTHTHNDSTLAKIIRLVTRGQEGKPKLTTWFDRLSRIYAMTIIAISGFLIFFLPHVFSIPFLGNDGSIYRSLAFLIAASPCALILAVPIAYVSALGACAKNGAVLKGGIVLDSLLECSTVAFDKTGTLTSGKLILDEIFSEDTEDPVFLLQTAASLEAHATHPIGKALVAEAEKRQLALFPIDSSKVLPGVGILGTIRTEEVEIVDPLSLPKEEYTQEIQAHLDQAKSKRYVVAVMRFRGKVTVFTFTDRPREGAKKLFQELKEMHIKTVMLTGDHKENAQYVADLLGIQSFYAALTPEDKLNYIERLSQKSGLVMVGDGINDAPALARATVGISMGDIASAAARDVSDIVLLHNNIAMVSWLFRKATKTRRIVLQNLTIAITAIVGASIPAIFGFVPLWLAVILHEGGTVLVGLNGLRLMRK